MKGKLWKILIGINILVIIAGCIINGRIRQGEIKFIEIPVYSWEGETGFYNCIDESFQDAKFWFAVKTGELAKGIYRVYINYETDVTSAMPQFFASGKSFIKADQLVLDAGDTELVQEIWVDKNIEYMDISIDRPNKGYLKVDSITVSRCVTRSFIYAMLKLIAFLLAVDMVCLALQYRQKLYNKSEVILGLICIIAVSSIGIFTQTLVIGHDMWFHLGRIEGLADGLLSGAFPVRIQPSWLEGYGYAVSVMYGELLLYFPAVLRAFGMPLQYAFKCYQLIVSILTVLISYYCFKKICKDRYIALTGSAVYSLSIYRMCDMHLRAAVGEYTAMIFLPLILLGTWDLFLSEEENRFSWLYLTAGFSGLIQTHVLSCEMAGLYMVFVCIACFKKVLCKKTIMVFCKTMIMVVLVNAWFLIPFLEYAKEDFKVFLDGGSIQWTGLTLYQLFSVNSSAGWEYLFQTRNVQLSLGIAVMIILILSCYLLTKKIWNGKEKKVFIKCLLFAVLSCFMSTVYFPWDALADINSLFSKLIVTIEFSWRFLTISMLFISLLTIFLLMKLKEKCTLKLLKGFAVFICVISAYQSLEYTDMVLRETENRTLYDGKQIRWESAVSDQGYYYKKDSPLELLSDKEVKTDVSVYNYDKNFNKIILDCKAAENGYIECPLYYYPHYHASDREGGEEFQVYSGNNGKLTVSVPKGYIGTMEISFREPWYWRAAELVSGVAIVLLIGYSMRSLKKRMGNRKRINEK